MKLRDSGMPEENYWESLFDIPLVLARLGIDSTTRDVAELGCGYGTFALPVARAIGGKLYTFDIEGIMVRRTLERARQAGIRNIVCRKRDVMEFGFDVPDPVDAVLLFNILHSQQPVRLLRHARATIRPGGTVLVIHWRTNVSTPRGPVLDIRPGPEQIVAWARQVDKLSCKHGVLELPPWHYGLVLQRIDAGSG